MRPANSRVYAEGMGVATGAAFDAEGNLFVGDRSGTIFKINPQRQIFVHATLEPSVAAYHLAVNAAGTLFVTAPSLSSNEAIWAIEPNGDTRAWYRGLGRPQGLAISQRRRRLSLPPACTAATDWCASRPRAKRRWFSPAPTSWALRFRRSAPPSWPPTTPFMMWTWESKA